MNTFELERSAADLTLHPALFSKERRESRWVDKDEIEVAVLTAWLNQFGDTCSLCRKTMVKNGKPSEVPVLGYIVPLDDGGTKKLDNIRILCNKCASKSE